MSKSRRNWARQPQGFAEKFLPLSSVSDRLYYFRIKLISAGSVIRRDLSLSLQNVQNNQQVLAISIETTPSETNAEDAMYDRLQRAKEDAQTLLKRDNSYMQVRMAASETL